MRILIITPQSNSRLAGNQTTAERWRMHLSALGHSVRIASVDERLETAGQEYDLLIALHAHRSLGPIRLWRHQFPDRPVILILTGTDLYRFQIDEPDIVQASMNIADRLVGLHDLVWRNVPPACREKLAVIRQSSPWLEERLPAPSSAKLDTFLVPDTFPVIVSGHLRQEKDSLRAAMAARDLPPQSNIRIRQAGKAHDDHWQTLVQKESAINPRLDYLGELDRDALFEEMQQARVMVMSSFMEGGANAVSEAILMELPVLASRIDGNVGLLGENYPAYFEAGDTQGLRELLLKAETDAGWLSGLKDHIGQLRPAFRLERERENIARLVDSLGDCRDPDDAG